MKKTIKPCDLIYKVTPRTKQLTTRVKSIFVPTKIGTAGVYRVGQALGGRIAMY